MYKLFIIVQKSTQSTKFHKKTTIYTIQQNSSTLYKNVHTKHKLFTQIYATIQIFSTTVFYKSLHFSTQLKHVQTLFCLNITLTPFTQLYTTSQNFTNKTNLQNFTITYNFTTPFAILHTNYTQLNTILQTCTALYKRYNTLHNSAQFYTTFAKLYTLVHTYNTLRHITILYTPMHTCTNF